MDYSRRAMSTASMKRVDHYHRTWDSLASVCSKLHPDWERDGAAGCVAAQLRIPREQVDCINECTKLVRTEFTHQVTFESYEAMEYSMQSDSGSHYIGLLELAIEDICTDLDMILEAYLKEQKKKCQIQAKTRPFQLLASWWVTGRYRGRANGWTSPLWSVTNANERGLSDIINGPSTSFS
ncbi:hypothetical protein F5Y03DRAFT_408811 [Xylaria venustula]|nr:hypothetical protein F5Y03DRAFT_408811 [Xylaria venustula]